MTAAIYTVSTGGAATIQMKAASAVHAAAMIGAHALKTTPDAVSVTLTGQNGDFYVYEVSDGFSTETVSVGQ